MPVNITFEGFSEEDFKKLVTDFKKAQASAFKYFSTEVWANIRKEAPTDEGRLAASFQLEPVDDLAWRLISGVHYAYYVWKGTGVYGESGQPITPVSAKALKFYSKKLGATVVMKGDLDTPYQKFRFCKWAEQNDMIGIPVWPKGIKPNDYPERSFNAASNRIDEFITRAIREEVG